MPINKPDAVWPEIDEQDSFKLTPYPNATPSAAAHVVKPNTRHADEMETNTSFGTTVTSVMNIRISRVVHGSHIGYEIPIDIANQGRDLATKLNQLISHELKIIRLIEACKDGFLMRRNSVHIAVASALLHLEDPESQPVNPAVYIHRSTYSEFLTCSLYVMSHLLPATSFISDHLPGIVAAETHWPTRSQTLFLRKACSKRAALAWFCAALALSVVVGVSAGIFSSDLKLGLGTGTGLLGVLGGVQSPEVYGIYGYTVVPCHLLTCGMGPLEEQVMGAGEFDHFICFGALHFLDRVTFNAVLSRIFMLARKSISFNIDDLDDFYLDMVRKKRVEFFLNTNHMQTLKDVALPMGWRVAYQSERQWLYRSPSTLSDVFGILVRFERI
ncbi:hypothetical protein QQS21_010386 [Conoideocrella luteorostrata]|uniref:Uncharacterized protein n=1 Tax=Conoideocrella luteorostrata TaxID=1105319 RepID=A0AAJ0FPG4_9HYPO|nr:hypothetical protein QQS21_010386 [Conoideocrella luteorostrata]